ncbi:MAG: hypothetical protein C0506_04275 [Anaerolinea sp.]|nr:hypothetical protein [Anaerolinea sp.]
MPDRVVVFIDSQNTYRGARDCFAPAVGRRHTDGQVDPVSVGSLICSRPPPGGARVLSEVRIYTGRPNSTKQPKAYAAHMRQCAVWERAGAVVIPRALRYPPAWPAEPPREKGIDVQLAIDYVAWAVDGRYDVGVIFSTDTDLRPALEFVAARFHGAPRAESAAWTSHGANRALRASNPAPTWCHYLDAADYGSVHDPTDYNVR